MISHNRYKLFRLRAFTDTKENFHAYELQWGHFDQPKDDHVVLGSWKTPDLKKETILDYEERIRGCRALVESCGGSFLDERKLTDPEKKALNDAAKKDGELRKKQSLEVAEAMLPGSGVRG